MITRQVGDKTVLVPWAGIFGGLDCMFCCPGPSLKDVTNEDVRKLGAFVMCLNKAYPKIKPDIWVGMDRPDCFEGGLVWDTFPKVFGDKFRMSSYEGRELRKLPNVYFLSGSAGSPEEFFTRKDDGQLHIWNGNTYESALHLAIAMGANRIYLLGCDFGGEDYHDGTELCPEHRARNKSLYQILLQKTFKLAECGKRYGVEIISATPDSPLNKKLAFVAPKDIKPRDNVKTDIDRPILDAQDADLLGWMQPQDPGYGVITGAGASDENLLPEWFSRYLKHNDYPVAFADFGLTPQSLQWCKQRGLVVKPEQTRAYNTFLRLPRPLQRQLGMLLTPFLMTIWSDVDKPIDKSLTETFDSIHNLKEEDGLVSYSHGDPQVQLRAKAMMLGCTLPDESKGVMTACDSGHEWLLPWWYENYRKYNDYPVLFMDYGLSDKMRAWCDDRGTVIPLSAPENLWYRKPFAMLMSSFQKTVFIEPDCEIRGPIGELFEQGDALCVTSDAHNPWSKEFRPVPYATGVVVFPKAHWLITGWARVVTEKEWRSDQEAFNSYITGLEKDRQAAGDILQPTEFRVLPKKWQALRLDKEIPDDAVIVHWTGRDGKRLIRGKIDGAKRDNSSPDRPAVADNLAGAAPLVSIIMPAHNAEKYIGQAVKSCIAQTHENWQLLIYDDGGNGLPKSIQVDKRITILRGPHVGYSKAINNCLKHAAGKYIAFCDADDILHPEKLQKQVNVLESTPEVDGVSCMAWHMDAEGTILDIRPAVPYEPHKYICGVRDSIHPPNPANMFRWSAFAEAGGYPEMVNQGADAGWLIRFFRIGKTMAHIATPLYGYRRVEGSATWRGAVEQTQNYYRFVMEGSNLHEIWERACQPFEYLYHKRKKNIWYTEEQRRKTKEGFFGLFGINPKDYGGKCVLDVGSGPYPIWTGEDVELACIEPLANDYSKFNNGAYATDSVHTQAAEQHIECLDDWADVIWCMNVLDHVYDWRKIIENMGKYAKQGCRLFLSTDAGEPAKMGHPGIEHKEDVRLEVEKAGFVVEKEVFLPPAGRKNITGNHDFVQRIVTIWATKK